MPAYRPVPVVSPPEALAIRVRQFRNGRYQPIPITLHRRRTVSTHQQREQTNTNCSRHHDPGLVQACAQEG